VVITADKHRRERAKGQKGDYSRYVQERKSKEVITADKHRRERVKGQQT